MDRLINVRPRLALNLYAIATARLERREAHMAALSEHSGLRAIARQLLALAKYAGATDATGVAILRPRPTHQLLAEMLGLRRETVTIGLQRLRRLGAIGLGSSHMWVDEVRMARVLETPCMLQGSKEETARVA